MFFKAAGEYDKESKRQSKYAQGLFTMWKQLHTLYRVILLV